jgi:hypothetical protein
MVHVLNKDGQPLMPTKRHGKVRHLLKDGKATVVKLKPFTIQLTYDTNDCVEPITLGVDSGYQNIGFSAVTEKEELIAGECKLLDGMTERITDKRKYRSQRRSRKRHRAARFNNRKRSDGWLAPSIQHKLDSHIKLVDMIETLLPISKIIIEVASFDIQAIKCPEIVGVDYQFGEQYGFWNLREYILHRDGHKCQNADCKNKSANPVLEVHHIGFWKLDRSNRPGNLITLCDKCHTPKDHKKSEFLWGWKPKIKSFRPETFMSTIRWRLVNLLEATHTYGYMTKSKRIEFSIEKSHANDAFVIAGGTTQIRTSPLLVEQVRRNNRSLQKFYDAKYIDVRTGRKEAASELHSGRRKRNKNLNGENFKKYRGKKISKGRITIRRQRPKFQPKDEVLYQGKVYRIKGSHNKGTRVILSTEKSVSVKEITLISQNKGLVFSKLS